MVVEALCLPLPAAIETAVKTYFAKKADCRTPEW